MEPKRPFIAAPFSDVSPPTTTRSFSDQDCCIFSDGIKFCELSLSGSQQPPPPEGSTGALESGHAASQTCLRTIWPPAAVARANHLRVTLVFSETRERELCNDARVPTKIMPQKNQKTPRRVIAQRRHTMASLAACRAPAASPRQRVAPKQHPPAAARVLRRCQAGATPRENEQQVAVFGLG